MAYTHYSLSPRRNRSPIQHSERSQSLKILLSLRFEKNSILELDNLHARGRTYTPSSTRYRYNGLCFYQRQEVKRRAQARERTRTLFICETSAMETIQNPKESLVIYRKERCSSQMNTDYLSEIGVICISLTIGSLRVNPFQSYPISGRLWISMLVNHCKLFSRKVIRSNEKRNLTNTTRPGLHGR